MLITVMLLIIIVFAPSVRTEPTIVIGEDNRLSYPYMVAMEKVEWDKGELCDENYYRNICKAICLITEKKNIEQQLPTALDPVIVPRNLVMLRQPFADAIKRTSEVLLDCRSLSGPVAAYEGDWMVDADRIQLSTYRQDKQGSPWVLKLKPNTGLGTGSLVEKDIVLTASHIVERSGIEMRPEDLVCIFGYFLKKIDGNITLNVNGFDEYYEVKKITRFNRTEGYDVAYLKLNRCAKTSYRSPLNIYKSANLQSEVVGKNIFTIGHPHGLELIYGDGTVSKKPTIEDCPDNSNQIKFGIYHEMDITGGFSGAPVFIKPNSFKDAKWNYSVIGVVAKGYLDFCLNTNRRLEELRVKEPLPWTNCSSVAHDLSYTEKLIWHTEPECPPVKDKKIIDDIDPRESTCLVHITVPLTAPELVLIWCDLESRVVEPKYGADFCIAVGRSYQAYMRTKVGAFEIIQSGRAGSNGCISCN